MKQCRECGTLSNDDIVFCAVCCTRFLDEHFDTAESVSVDQHDGNESIPNRSINEVVIPLLQRISLFLEDEEYDRADAYCERVLDMEPMNAEAYIDKLLVEFRCSSVDQLQSCMSDICKQELCQSSTIWERPAAKNDSFNKRFNTKNSSGKG